MFFANVDSDESASTLTVRGSEEKLARTDWLLRELDRPAAKAGSRMDRYEVSAALYKELGGPLFPKPPDVSDQAMGVFFLNTLDVAPGNSTTGPDFKSGTDVVRVFSTDIGANPAARRQITIALLEVVGIQHVFDFSALAAIAVRGSADEIAAADWLMRSLQPKSSSGEREFQLAGTDREDNVMRVFYQPHAKVDTLKSSAFSSPDAVLVRGSESQVAAVEQLMTAPK